MAAVAWSVDSSSFVHTCARRPVVGQVMTRVSIGCYRRSGGRANCATSNQSAMIAADVEARRLLDTNPDCQIPFEELREAIATLAVRRGVGVEFGLRPD